MYAQLSRRWGRWPKTGVRYGVTDRIVAIGCVFVSQINSCRNLVRAVPTSSLSMPKQSVYQCLTVCIKNTNRVPRRRPWKSLLPKSNKRTRSFSWRGIQLGNAAGSEKPGGPLSRGVVLKTRCHCELFRRPPFGCKVKLHMAWYAFRNGDGRHLEYHCGRTNSDEP